MKIKIQILIVICALLSAKATAASWKFTESEDRFDNEVTYGARFSGEKIVGFTDMVGVHHTEFMTFGLRCDVKDGFIENILVRFSFEMPIAYYNHRIRFLIDANDRVFKFDGQMFSNSMSSGFASIKYDNERDNLIDALAKGRFVSFRIDPDGSGETREETLTLKGSSKAIAQWKAKCL